MPLDEFGILLTATLCAGEGFYLFFSTCGKMREASLWIRRSVEIMQMQMTRCAFDFFPGKNLFYRSSALGFS